MGRFDIISERLKDGIVSLRFTLYHTVAFSLKFHNSIAENSAFSPSIATMWGEAVNWKHIARNIPTMYTVFQNSNLNYSPDASTPLVFR